MKRATYLCLLALLACNRSSDNGLATSPLIVGPVAIAGDDAKALILTLVTLNGSKSYDPSGLAITYQWTQTSGTAVVLSSATAAMPTFTAPGAAEELTFELRVTSASGTDTDSVAIHVKKLVVSAPDKWWLGYGNAGSITATVAGGTGTLTYEWTGLGSYFSAVAGTATTTMTFTTPAFPDLQVFPDRAGVAVLMRTAQGRNQVKIRVTDDMGTPGVPGDDVSDEDLAMVSAGPFSVMVASENVALGEPVFLNGGETTSSGTITSWTWTGTTPTGGAISFLRPAKTALAGATDQRYVVFVPSLVGDYQVILTQNPGAVVKVIDITCGKYVGVGSQLGTTPDPFKGECAACHAGQLPWLASFATTWEQTGHARMFSDLLDSAHPLYTGSQAKEKWQDLFEFGSNYSIPERTTGWSAITATANDGWVKRATDEGYVFKGTSWAELKRKHPKTAALSNVQCEACHGPGSEHAGDTTGIRKSYRAENCGRCHARKQEVWEASGHGSPPSAYASGSSSCNGCHTGQGFIVEMRAQEGADPHTALFAYSNLNRPVLPADDRVGTTCQACHDPHKKTAKLGATGSDPQLRAYGNVSFRNGQVADAGPAAVCFMCHQSRTDTTAGSGDETIRRAPHDSTAAEMLSGVNGSQFAGSTYLNSPHGIPSRFVTPGKGNRSCLACHHDVSPPKGASGYNALGNHTFAVHQGSGASIADQTTHAGGATVSGTKRFVVTGGPTFLRQVFAGDILTIAAGADAGSYTITAVDSARQVTVSVGASFGGGAATTWSVTSVKKYNVSSCTQCHTVALDFQVTARHDYDGDLSLESVQDEVAGLIAALTAAIEAKLSANPAVGAGTLLTEDSGRIKYDKGGLGTQLYTFPGPGVTGSQNPDISWGSLTPAEQQEWQTLYKAAYNIYFVEHDKSEGIHNTGYAVTLLQSSYKEVTGSAIGTAFVPFP